MLASMFSVNALLFKVYMYHYINWYDINTNAIQWLKAVIYMLLYCQKSVLIVAALFVSVETSGISAVPVMLDNYFHSLAVGCKIIQVPTVT